MTDEDLTSTPTSIHWSQLGATTPVKDQRQCGSCGAYSTIEGSESAVYMAQGVLEELAVQQIILCDNTDGGCNGGELHTVFDYVQNTIGCICSDSDDPETSNTQGGLRDASGWKQSVLLDVEVGRSRWRTLS